MHGPLREVRRLSTWCSPTGRLNTGLLLVIALYGKQLEKVEFEKCRLQSPSAYGMHPTKFPEYRTYAPAKSTTLTAGRRN